MRYYVGIATGKGSFTIDAEEVELTDTWAIFRNDGKVEHAMAATSVSMISQLDEKGEPRIGMSARGLPDWSNLPD